MNLFDKRNPRNPRLASPHEPSAMISKGVSTLAGNVCLQRLMEVFASTPAFTRSAHINIPRAAKYK
jgi:hypothetical protein